MGASQWGELMSDSQQSAPRDPWAPPEEHAPPHDRPAPAAGYAVSAPPPAPAPQLHGAPYAQGPHPAQPYGTQQFHGVPPYGAQPYDAPGSAPYPGVAPYPGTAPYPGALRPEWPVQPSNGMGITALVLGLIGLLSSLTIVLGIVLGLLAVVFGFIGRAKARRGEANNGGMALAGVLCGVGAIAVSTLLVLAIVVAAVPDPTPIDDGGSDTYRAAPAAPQGARP